MFEELLYWYYFRFKIEIYIYSIFIGNENKNEIIEKINYLNLFNSVLINSNNPKKYTPIHKTLTPKKRKIFSHEFSS